MATNQESPMSARPAGNGSVSGANGATHGLLGEIQQKVTSQVDHQKNRAADGLGGIADVIRTAGNELRTENEALASYIEGASQQLRRFADHIRQRGVEDIYDDVHRFAQRRPEVFIGGAFLVGLALARVMKSTANRRGHDAAESGYGRIDPLMSE
jgi:hypothetical protein